MNWLHWWIPQFLLLLPLILILAPTAGALFLKSSRIQGAFVNENLEFIVGFCLLYAVASFLTPLHQLALIVLYGLLVYLKVFKRIPTTFKLNLGDVIVLPVLICTVFYPVIIDFNTSHLQYSIFHQWWPLDGGPRLDTHCALAVVMTYWFKDVPLMNSVSVQSPFFALLIWRGIIYCWQLLKEKYPRPGEQVLLAVFYMGTLYYRKQLDTKASPIGGYFAILSVILLCLEVPPLLTGFFISASLWFGEYGAILVAGTALFCFFQGGRLKENLVACVPYVILFSAPEVIRKVFIASHGNFFAAMLVSAALFLGWFCRKPFGKLLNQLPTVGNRSAILVIVLGFATAAVSLFFPMPQFDHNSSSLWHWSVGTSGILFILSANYLWKNRTSDLSSAFFNLTSIQLIFLSLWHFADYFNPTYNPNGIWWNLGKNAMMISWPLVTTIFGALYFSEKFEDMNKKKWLGFAALVTFFVFLQDPLVKQVSHGPFAPHGPRFSVYRNLYEMYWHAIHAPSNSSTDGNVVLIHRSLPDGDLVEALLKKQAAFGNRMDICFAEKSFPDYSIEAYTLSYFTGVRDFPNKDNCPFVLLRAGDDCPQNTKTVVSGRLAHVCGSGIL